MFMLNMIPLVRELGRKEPRGWTGPLRDLAPGGNLGRNGCYQAPSVRISGGKIVRIVLFYFLFSIVYLILCSCITFEH